ncbi:MAG: PAS domain-containing sensor histidine kinase [Anaerolineae bacterium]|nr:PAS domain-containing sensor histidine kinase [Anaerolineae bacterium]MDW8172917.1 PAS domain-containing sensor histidine kinase [Anaerolineae bacterium]
MNATTRLVTWFTLLAWLVILADLVLSLSLSEAWNTTMVLLWLSSVFCGLLLIALNVVLYRQSRELAENDLRLHRLMDATFDALVITDHQGRILDGNASLERLTGHTLEAMRNTSMLRYVHPEDRHRAALYFNQLQETEPLIVRVQHSQGTSTPIEVVTKPLVYRGQSVLVTIARDISERHEEQRRRRESQLRYDALFNQTADAVFIISNDGILLETNPSGLRMLGLPPGAEVHGPMDQYILPEESHDSEQIRQHLQTGQIVPVYERTFRRKDKTTFPGEVSIMLVRDEDGQPMYIQSIVRDISERKKAAQNEMLAQMQQERLALLRALVDDFSHHVRTPLANIKNCVYLYTRLPEERRPSLEATIDFEIERLKLLLDDLVLITSLERDPRNESVELIDVNALVYSLIPEAQHSPHRWQVDLDIGAPRLYGNRARLAQALRRLLHNAVVYTPHGKAIHVRTQAQPNRIQIEIVDEGIGIDQEARLHIFENFHRADAAREVYPQGVGLGLPIAQKIIRAHDGLIEIRPHHPQGTLVRVTLPLVQAHSTPVA